MITMQMNSAIEIGADKSSFSVSATSNNCSSSDSKQKWSSAFSPLYRFGSKLWV